MKKPTYKQLEQEIERLNKIIRAMEMFSPEIYKCKSCDGYYARGYICDCGRDNSYSDDEWAKLQEEKTNAS